MSAVAYDTAIDYRRRKKRKSRHIQWWRNEASHVRENSLSNVVWTAAWWPLREQDRIRRLPNEKQRRPCYSNWDMQSLLHSRQVELVIRMSGVSLRRLCRELAEARIVEAATLLTSKLYYLPACLMRKMVYNCGILDILMISMDTIC